MCSFCPLTACPPGDVHFSVHASPRNEHSAQLLPSMCAFSLRASSANITHLLLPYCQKLASRFLFSLNHIFLRTIHAGPLLA